MLIDSCTISTEQVKTFSKVGLCGSNGYKATGYQSWRSEKNPAARLDLSQMRVAQVWSPSHSDHPQSLTDDNFAAIWPTKTYSTSLERSKPSKKNILSA